MNPAQTWEKRLRGLLHARKRTDARFGYKGRASARLSKRLDAFRTLHAQSLKAGRT